MMETKDLTFDWLPLYTTLWDNMPVGIKQAFYMEWPTMVIPELISKDGTYAGKKIQKDGNGNLIVYYETQRLELNNWEEIGDWYWHHGSWIIFNERLDSGYWKGEDGKVLDRKTITPYLKHYYEGFLVGYNSFDDEMKTPTTSLIALSESQIAKRIADVAKREGVIGCLELSGWPAHQTDLSVIRVKFWRYQGEELGKYYRAWYIIMTNAEKFAEYFPEKTDASKSENRQQDAPSPSEPTNQEIIEKWLGCFRKSKKGHGRIMNDEDYKRLLEYVLELDEKKKAPKVNKPFAKLILSNAFIRVLFSKLYDELYSKREKDWAWIDFIHSAFKQFSNTDKNTTFDKFRTYTTANSFDTDFKGIMEE